MLMGPSNMASNQVICLHVTSHHVRSESTPYDVSNVADLNGKCSLHSGLAVTFVTLVTLMSNPLLID